MEGEIIQQVIHAHEKISKLLKEDQQLQEEIQTITNTSWKIIVWITYVFSTQGYAQGINM